ncbi:MAG: response regulator transcription factor [Candidatus Didemnitutus sp.]|nr:response regulator transcription factor [Candidatus Didemnitutus sp.]
MRIPANTPIRILLVDDSAIVRHGIRAAIEYAADGRRLEIVAEAATAADALREAQRVQPDVVLLDLRLPDTSGIAICGELRAAAPSARVIVFTSSTDSRTIYDVIVAGADGYLLKEIDPAALVQGIVDGHAGRSVFSPDIAGRMVDILRDGHARLDRAACLHELSPQERRVLAAMAEGQTNKDIAQLLGLSENTVKNYIGRVFEKLGVQRRSQAIALYFDDKTRATTS